jgi:hypothetical protein
LDEGLIYLPSFEIFVSIWDGDFIDVAIPLTPKSVKKCFGCWSWEAGAR